MRGDLLNSQEKESLSLSFTLLLVDVNDSMVIVNPQHGWVNPKTWAKKSEQCTITKCSNAILQEKHANIYIWKTMNEDEKTKQSIKKINMKTATQQKMHWKCQQGVTLIYPYKLDKLTGTNDGMPRKHLVTTILLSFLLSGSVTKHIPIAIGGTNVKFLQASSQKRQCQFVLLYYTHILLLSLKQHSLFQHKNVY